MTSIGFSQNNLRYKATKEKTHTLVHTQLKVDFNFEKKQLNGEAWVTVKPHFYATNRLTLDAKSMLIHEVSLNGNTLEYDYDNYEITLKLPKKFTKEEGTNRCKFNYTEEKLRLTWCEYHREKATLRPLCKTCNLTRGYT